jgi:ribosomal protein L11 methyltransferase
LDTLYRWSKFVEEDRLEDWENRFLAEEVSYVLEKPVKRRRWLLSVYTPTEEEAEDLRVRFGGSVEPLAPALWQPAPRDGRPNLLRIRDRLIITDTEDAEAIARIERDHPGRLVLGFPSQLAFGTGSHPTTAGCLRFLVDLARTRPVGEWRVLDLGCGSGILAIAAAKLGATRVLAVENDPMALEYARGNAVRHGVAGSIEFVEDDAVRLMLEPPSQPWDLIAANLFSDLLVTLFPRFPAHLERGGEVIVSGFLATQAETVGKAAVKAGLPVRDLVRRGKWMAARCRP